MLFRSITRYVKNDPRWPAFLNRLGLREYWLQMPPERGSAI